MNGSRGRSLPLALWGSGEAVALAWHNSGTRRCCCLLRAPAPRPWWAGGWRRGSPGVTVLGGSCAAAWGWQQPQSSSALPARPAHCPSFLPRESQRVTPRGHRSPARSAAGPATAPHPLNKAARTPGLQHHCHLSLAFPLHPAATSGTTWPRAPQRRPAHGHQGLVPNGWAMPRAGHRDCLGEVHSGAQGVGLCCVSPAAHTRGRACALPTPRQL